MVSEHAVAEVEEALLSLWIDAGEPVALRREDAKKAREVAALLDKLPTTRGRVVVDAAAGHGYVGLLYAHKMGAKKLIVLEREAARGQRVLGVSRRLCPASDVEVRLGDVGDSALWPMAPDVVIALHACGAASDAIIDRAIGAQARWLFLVPCCYGPAVPFFTTAAARAEALGLPRQRALRQRFAETLVDGERTLRLEAAGYEVSAASFVPQRVTPHNLLIRARRAGEAVRMAAAKERLARLRG